MIYSIYLFTNPEKNNIKLLILYSYLDTLMAYVYIVKCYDDSYYTGSTKNLSERIKKHNSCKGAKYTMGRTPVILVYYEEFKNFNDALKRECAIKKLKKEEKEQLTKIIKECPL